MRTITGTAGADLLFANEAAIINGLGGDDQLVGSSGNDIIDGGGGRDRVWAQAGNDTITLRPGSSVYGEAGYDIVISAVPVLGVFAYPKAPVEPALLVQYSLEQNPPFDRADLRAEVLIANNGTFVVLQETAINLALLNFYELTGIASRATGLAYCAERLVAGVTLAQIGDVFAKTDEFKNGLGKLTPEVFARTMYQQALGWSGDAAGIAHTVNVYNTYGAGSALAIFAEAQGQIEAAKLLTPGFQAIGQGSFTVMDA